MNSTLDPAADAWAVSTCIDLYGCDLALMQDEAAVRRFVVELCGLIRLRRSGEAPVVRFGGSGRAAGFSLMQLSETSLVSAHFADEARAVYVDVFACAPYDPEAVAVFAHEFFKAHGCHIQVNIRR